MSSNILILLFLIVWGVDNLYAKKEKSVCDKNPNKTKYGQDLVENSKCAMNLAGWECLEGYVQRRDKCLKLKLPRNAILNEDTHTWSCKRGHKKYRNVCKKIKLPKDAKLTDDGHDWICSKGYTRYKHRCIKKSK